MSDDVATEEDHSWREILQLPADGAQAPFQSPIMDQVPDAGQAAGERLNQAPNQARRTRFGGVRIEARPVGDSRCGARRHMLFDVGVRAGKQEGRGEAGQRAEPGRQVGEGGVVGVDVGDEQDLDHDLSAVVSASMTIRFRHQANTG